MIISAVFGANAVVFADDEVQQCGDNIEAKYSASQNTLTLSGSGAMWDNLNFPWAGKNITDIIIKDGITHIGNSAFAAMFMLKCFNSEYRKKHRKKCVFRQYVS